MINREAVLNDIEENKIIVIINYKIGLNSYLFYLCLYINILLYPYF